MISNVYATFGVDYAWSLEFIVLGSNLLAFFPLYSRMVPLNYATNLASIKVHPIGSERKSSVTSLKSEKSGDSDMSSSQNTQRTNVH
jgi:hypothetical protein